MDDRVVELLNKLGKRSQYSLLVARILKDQGDSEALIELIRRLRAYGDLESVKTLAASLNDADDLVKEADEIGFRHPYLTSDLAVFLRASGLKSEKWDEHLRQRIEEERDILRYRAMSSRERWKEIHDLANHVRSYLHSDISKLWMKPSRISALFEKTGRPSYDLESAHRLIDDILSYCQSEIVPTPTEDEIQSIGERLATISDSELCCMWFLTVGELLLTQNDRTADEEMDEWLKGEYDAVVSGTRQKWKEGTTFDNARINTLRESKAALNEIVLGSESYLEPSNTYLHEIFMEFIDLSTGCVMWEHLCHDGVLPGWLLTVDLENTAVEEVKASGLAHVYTEAMHRVMENAIDRHYTIVTRLIAEFFSLENLTYFVKAIRIASA